MFLRWTCLFVCVQAATHGLLVVHPYYGQSEHRGVGIAVLVASVLLALFAGRHSRACDPVRVIAAVGCAYVVLEGIAAMHVRQMALPAATYLADLLRPITHFDALADGSAGVRSHEGALIIRPTLDKLGLPFIGVAASLLVTGLPLSMRKALLLVLAAILIAEWRFVLVSHFFVDHFGPGLIGAPNPLLWYDSAAIDAVAAGLLAFVAVRRLEEPK